MNDPQLRIYYHNIKVQRQGLSEVVHGVNSWTLGLVAAGIAQYFGLFRIKAIHIVHVSPEIVEGISRAKLTDQYKSNFGIVQDPWRKHGIWPSVP